MDAQHTVVKNNHTFVLLYFQELSTNSTTHASSRRGGDVFLCSPNNQLVEEKVRERKASLVALCVENQFMMKNEQELCSE